MNSDPTSLDNLRYIVVLPPVSWWPPAPGWWILAAILFIATLIIAARSWLNWRANAYRRAALSELQHANSAGDVAEILKRTALCTSPRRQIAALSGNQWCHWLAETSGKAPSQSAQSALTVGIFQESESADIGDLLAYATFWIRNHRQVDAATDSAMKAPPQRQLEAT